MNQLSVIIKPSKRYGYTAKFKKQVIAACAEHDASGAGIGLEYSLNANMLRKWVREQNSVRPTLGPPFFVALPMLGAKDGQPITDNACEVGV